YNPSISALEVDLQPGSFTVRYVAEVRDAQQQLRYTATIRGDETGHLSFSATAEAQTDFLTNRTGFVVLHPVEGVAGKPVTIEHVDRRLVEAGFAELLDALPAMMDLRALTHEPVSVLKGGCRMEGKTF